MLQTMSSSHPSGFHSQSGFETKSWPYAKIYSYSLYGRRVLVLDDDIGLYEPVGMKGTKVKESEFENTIAIAWNVERRRARRSKAPDSLDRDT